MPFPPNFTNAWDNTFPPDTQAANLLGQDIRNFKTDVQQRFALLSGTLANRPANMDATFGGAGFGTLYFATDTSQIFQWNGAAWTDVTSSFSPGGKLSNGAATVIAGGADGPILQIPANTLSVGSIIRVYADYTPAGVGMQPKFFFGSTALLFPGLPGDTNWFSFDVEILVTGAATQQLSAFGHFHESLPNDSVMSVPITAGVEAINANINVLFHNLAAVNVTQNFMTIVWR